MTFKTLHFTVSALAAALVLAGSPAQGGNRLVNRGFEANSGHAVATGWTYFSPPPPPGYFGDYWIESNVPAHSGTLYWKEWGALYLPSPTNNVAGIYQDLSSAPGSTYQANGWFFTKGSDVMGPNCFVWVEVSFLGASSNLLALYKSDNFAASAGTDAWFPYSVTNACDLSSPVPSGDPYFTTYAVTGSVSQLIAPVGTVTVRYRFDNVYLKDTNGFLVNVVLNGKDTLRVTSGGDLLPGFFMLVAAKVDLPRLSLPARIRSSKPTPSVLQLPRRAALFLPAASE